VDGFAQTFPAVVRRAALPWLRAALQSGRGGCFAAFQAAAEGLRKSIHVVPIERVVKEWELALLKELPVQYWFLNVNAPADLLRAKACLADRKSQVR
jgi:molybdopterin-guanine dinucleotide biosynthesis protein A